MLLSHVQKFLDELFIKYSLHSNVNTESTFQYAAYAQSIGACAIKVVLFSDEKGPLLATFCAKDGLDFDELAKETERNLKLDPGVKYKNHLKGFSVKNLPPFGRLFQIPTIVDETLLNSNRYLIDIGQGQTFVEIDKKGFLTLLKGAKRKKFSRVIPNQVTNVDSEKTQNAPSSRENTPVTGVTGSTNKVDELSDNVKKGERGPLLTKESVESQFADDSRMPAMPEVGKKLVALKAGEDFDMVDLVHLIESDPMISAKIIAYASSPFFAYQGKLETVQEAVYHVLGIDLSLNISLALALGRNFRGPMTGPYGASSVWRHSVYCGVLSQSIASTFPSELQIKPGTAYLFGLLHNIGFLALGHLFPKKFSLFNKAIAMKKEIPLERMEKNILGVSHATVGGLLMSTWSLPKEYGFIISEHHNPDYEGEYAAFVHILILSNILLKSLSVGDASETELPPVLLARYGLNENVLREMLEIVMQWHENLDHLAQQLVA